MNDVNDERLKRVEARKHNRNLYMTAIYELYEESGETWVPRPKISERAELSFDKTVEAESYWESQGLVKTVGGGRDGSIEILPYGIEVMEDNIRRIAEEEQAELEAGAGQPAIQAPDTMDIFISHANQDATIAEALADLLRAALNLAPARIRCTSVDGYRLNAGDNVNEQLRAEILECRVFIGLITETSAESKFVLFELGGRWLASKPLLPLLAAGAPASALPGPLGGFNALKCDSEEQVLQFVRNVGEKLGQTPNSVESYLGKVRALVERSKDAEKSAKKQAKEALT